MYMRLTLGVSILRLYFNDFKRWGDLHERAIMYTSYKYECDRIKEMGKVLLIYVYTRLMNYTGFNKLKIKICAKMIFRGNRGQPFFYYYTGCIYASNDKCIRVYCICWLIF